MGAVCRQEEGRGLGEKRTHLLQAAQVNLLPKLKVQTQVPPVLTDQRHTQTALLHREVREHLQTGEMTSQMTSQNHRKHQSSPSPLLLLSPIFALKQIPCFIIINAHSNARLAWQFDERYLNAACGYGTVDCRETGRLRFPFSKNKASKLQLTQTASGR